MTIEKNDDYIKRSWALQEIEHDLRCHDISRSTEKSLFVNLGDVVRMLLAAPKENVVPVVRCGECKHWHQETGYCELHSYFHDSDNLSCSPAESSSWTMWDEKDFCSDGERRVEHGRMGEGK